MPSTEVSGIITAEQPEQLQLEHSEEDVEDKVSSDQNYDIIADGDDESNITEPTKTTSSVQSELVHEESIKRTSLLADQGIEEPTEFAIQRPSLHVGQLAAHGTYEHVVDGNRTRQSEEVPAVTTDKVADRIIPEVDESHIAESSKRTSSDVVDEELIKRTSLLTEKEGVKEPDEFAIHGEEVARDPDDLLPPPPPSPAGEWTPMTDDLMMKKKAQSGLSPRSAQPTVRENIDRRLFSTGNVSADAAQQSKGSPTKTNNKANRMVEHKSAWLSSASPTMSDKYKRGASTGTVVVPGAAASQATDTRIESKARLVETVLGSELSGRGRKNVVEEGIDDDDSSAHQPVSGAATVRSKKDVLIERKRACESLVGQEVANSEEEGKTEEESIIHDNAVMGVDLQSLGAVAFNDPANERQTSNVSSVPGAFALYPAGRVHGHRSNPDGAAPPPQHRNDGDRASETFLIEATLVDDDDRETNKDLEDGMVATAVAAKPLKFGVNFGDRRVRISIIVVVLAIVGLALGLGVSLSGNSSSSDQNSNNDGGDQPADAEFSAGILPTPSPTKSTSPSLYPTAIPSSTPSTAPTAAPTHWTWEEIREFTGNPNGMFGSKVMISNNGTRLAVAYKRGQELCHVRHRGLRNTKTKRDLECYDANTLLEMYEQNGTEWISMGRGLDMDGFQSFQLKTNTAVALSGNGKRAATVSPQGTTIYQVRDADPSNVFSGDTFSIYFTQSVWPVEDTSGADVALNYEGDTVAIAQPNNNSGKGKVRVIRYFEQCVPGPIPNSTICGFPSIAANDVSFNKTQLSSFGQTLALSSSGTVVACGAKKGGGFGGTYVVQVYEGTGPSWSPLGGQIEAKAFPSSMSLSADGYRIALGGSDMPNSPLSLATGMWQGEGEARVLDYNTTTNTWMQVGNSIKTGTNGLYSVSVSLSGDGMTLAVGVGDSHEGGNDSGVARVYRFDGASWAQVETDIYGLPGDKAGRSVSVTGNGRRVAVGAPLNHGNGGDGGAARVYEMTSTK